VHTPSLAHQSEGGDPMSSGLRAGSFSPGFDVAEQSSL
jgi:hypothetical protein